MVYPIYIERAITSLRRKRDYSSWPFVILHVDIMDHSVVESASHCNPDIEPMKNSTLDSHLHIRVNLKTRNAFRKKAAKYDRGVTELARELIEAWIDDRITISPPEGVSSLYTTTQE